MYSVEVLSKPIFFVGGRWEAKSKPQSFKMEGKPHPVNVMEVNGNLMISRDTLILLHIRIAANPTSCTNNMGSVLLEPMEGKIIMEPKCLRRQT